MCRGQASHGMQLPSKYIKAQTLSATDQAQLQAATRQKRHDDVHLVARIAEKRLCEVMLAGPMKKTKPQRPCKAKRNRYHKLVQGATVELLKNPSGSSILLLLDTVPQSVRNNEWLLKKFLCRMEKIQERLHTTEYGQLPQKGVLMR